MIRWLTALVVALPAFALANSTMVPGGAPIFGPEGGSGGNCGALAGQVTGPCNANTVSNVIPTGGTTASTLSNLADRFYSILDSGAACDAGITNDRPALVAADALTGIASIRIPANRTCRIATSITVNHPICLEYGATLSFDTGAVPTLNGGLGCGSMAGAP